MQITEAEAELILEAIDVWAWARAWEPENPPGTDREFSASNDVWAALIDEPMVQLHGCATRFVTILVSA
jgi:hypothetical protein